MSFKDILNATRGLKLLPILAMWDILLWLEFSRINGYCNKAGWAASIINARNLLCDNRCLRIRVRYGWMLPAYVVLATFAPAALTNLGVPLISPSHGIVVWATFHVTPPVAMAYAATSITQSGFGR